MKTASVLMVVWMGLFCASAQADNCWWDVCNGDWFDADNWIPHIPQSGDTVYIDNGCGGPLITDPGAYAGIVYVGFDTPDNTLTLGGVSSSLAVTELFLGEAEGTEGALTVSGLSQLTAGAEYVGFYGSGTVIQTGGSNSTTSGYLVVGYHPGSMGTYTLSGAGVLTTASRLVVGHVGGTGVFQQLGGTVTCSSINLTGGESRYELHYPGVLLATGNIDVRPNYGPSTFLQTGGTCTAQYLWVRSCGDFSAFYELTGGELTVSEHLFVGTDWGSYCELPPGVGLATFTQSGGVNTVAGTIFVGSSTMNGLYELSGDPNTVLSAQIEIVGEGATGTIVQTGGINTVGDPNDPNVVGKLTVGAGDYCYGGNPPAPGIGRYELGGTGELIVDGEEFIGHDGTIECPDSRGDFIQTGGTHTVATLYIGNHSPGGYMQSGGTTAVQTFLYVGNTPGSTGTYEISDGELSALKLWVGYEGCGEFTQTGGVVTVDDLDVARVSGATGAYELSADGALMVEDCLTVGRTGQGGLTLNGGTLVTQTLRVGRYSGLGSMAITDPFGEVTVGTDLTFGGNAFFEAEPSTVIHMTHDPNGTVAALFDNRSTSEFSLSGLANLELSFECGADLTSTMEIASADLGGEESGFNNNFALGTLRVGIMETPAHVMLVDARDNGNRGGVGGEAEALYVDKIFLSPGSTFDLNGLHVYYHRLCNDGGTIELNGGLLEQVGCLGDLDGDGDVDLDDLAALLSAYGSFEGDPNYNPAADFCDDGDVDLADLAVLLANYGCGL